ncbi:MAG: c-type cytochrome [Caulobacteraceae bacterium]
MNHRILIGGLVLSLALAARAFAAEADDVAEGKRLALQTCTACHRVAADQTRAPSLKPEAPTFVSVANGPSLDAANLHDFLMSQHRSQKTPPDMPTMVLSEREASLLTLYIASLRKAP